MANPRTIGDCWPCVSTIKIVRGPIKLEPAIEIWGTNSKGNCLREPSFLGPCAGGKEKGEE